MLLKTKFSQSIVEPEKTYSVVVISIVVFVSVGAVAFMLLNAKTSEPKQFFNPYFLTGGAVRHYCSDSDGGIVPYLRGITTTERRQVIDRCTAVGVVEYSCTMNGELMATSIPCPAGCDAGACVKSVLVGYAFNPFLNSKLNNALKG